MNKWRGGKKEDIPLRTHLNRQWLERLKKEKEGYAKSTPEKKERPSTNIKAVLRVLHEDNHKSCIWVLQLKALSTTGCLKACLHHVPQVSDTVTWTVCWCR